MEGPAEAIPGSFEKGKKARKPGGIKEFLSPKQKLTLTKEGDCDKEGCFPLVMGSFEGKAILHEREALRIRGVAQLSNGKKTLYENSLSRMSRPEERGTTIVADLPRKGRIAQYHGEKRLRGKGKKNRPFW